MPRSSAPRSATAARSVSWSGVIRPSTTPRSASSSRSAELGVDLELTVIPGISSIQLLAARHKIILNRVGQPIHVTTGRRLLDEYSPALGDVVVMLDGDLACGGLVERFGDLMIYWGAQLGLPDEALISGRLSEVIDEIRAKRAAVRDARGWVMDTYLLRP